MTALSTLQEFTQSSPVVAHRRIADGIGCAEALQLLSSLDVPIEVQARLLVVSPRTLRRWSRAPSAAKLSVNAGNQLYRFAVLFTQAIDAFGSAQAALEWFQEGQTGLDGKEPIELVFTSPGARVLEQLLGRLQYGVHT